MNKVQFDYIMSSLEARYLTQTTEVDTQITLKKNEMLELHTQHDAKINELKAEILMLENRKRTIKLAWATEKNKAMTDFVRLEEGDQTAECGYAENTNLDRKSSSKDPDEFPATDSGSHANQPPQ